MLKLLNKKDDWQPSKINAYLQAANFLRAMEKANVGRAAEPAPRAE